MQTLMWLLLPIAAVSGWWVARREYLGGQTKVRERLPQDYFRGLSYLLNEQPDKAIDVFIKMLDIDSETVEIHLALGSLYRRRGEVERAIRIHQNLIARPTIAVELRRQSVLELARDYMSAGLLDRAESLCQELTEGETCHLPALFLLCEIYQQERDWAKAIDTARRMESCGERVWSPVIAQFHCELAEEARRRGDMVEARRQVRLALQEDAGCVRATIIHGEIERAAGNTVEALAVYQTVERQAPQFLSEVIEPMRACDGSESGKRKMIEYLQRVLRAHGGIDVLLALTEIIGEVDGDEAAERFLAQALRNMPSLRGLHRYAVLVARRAADADAVQTIAAALGKLLEKKPVYICSKCGFSGMVMHWHCPGCKCWNTIQPIQEFHWGSSV